MLNFILIRIGVCFMDIFEFAMNFERDSEEYYNNLYTKCTNRILKPILKMLAEDEVKHYKILVEMKNNIKVNLNQTNILKDSKEVFIKLKSDIDLNEIDDMSILLEKAKKFEIKSKDYYLKKSEEVIGNDQKIVLKEIAKQEEQHYFLLDNLMEFLSRPKSWVENAEFNHLDEY